MSPVFSEILIAGHGGQGVVDLGSYIAYAAMVEGRHVAYTPTYGPESRGGKVKCYVVLSDGEIDSPMAEEPELLIVMNIPSMDFEPVLKSGGHFVYNKSLITGEPVRSDTVRVPVRATELADRLREKLPPDVLEGISDTKLAQNSVVFGVYLALTGKPLSLAKEVFGHFYTGRKAKYIPLNMAAVEAGMRVVEGEAAR